MSAMVVAYVAHPLAAPTRDEIDANLRKASRWAAWALLQGVSPVCSWIVMVGEFGETPETRARGLQADCAQVERCDVVLLVGDEVTSGMRVEREHARQRGIAVLDLTGMTALAAEAALQAWLRERSRSRETLPAPSEVAC